MSDDKDNDLTRIENIAEFHHDEEDDDFSDLETFKSDSFESDKDELPPAFSEEVTNPNFKLPDSFSQEQTLAEHENPFLTDDNEDFSQNFQVDSDDLNSDSFEFNLGNEESDNFETESNEFNNFETESNEFNNLEDEVNEEINFETDDSESELEKVSDTNFSFETNDEIEDDLDFSISEENTNDEDFEFVEENSITSSSELTNTPSEVSPAETFQDLRKFSESISYGNLLSEGNPPFTVIIKDIRFNEDVDDIIILLKEFGLIKKEDENQMRESLERGSAIIPRISEYAAIVLCHKLRRFNINILMGLSDEIQPSKSFQSKEVGTISKNSVYNNQSHNFELKNRISQITDIITTTTSMIEGMDIIQYLGVVSERTIVDMDHFQDDHSLENELIGHMHKIEKENVISQKVSLQNKLATNSNTPPIPPWPESEEKSNLSKVCLADIYQSLIDKLKAHALKFQGNAIVGINFVVTPILIDNAMAINSKYQISCTGSVVWVSKR